MPEPIVRETTSPAAFETGARTFTMEIRPGQRIQLMACQLLQEGDCPGEIHPAETYILTQDPVLNDDLARALFSLVGTLFKAPAHTTSLPAA